MNPKALSALGSVTPISRIPSPSLAIISHDIRRLLAARAPLPGTTHRALHDLPCLASHCPLPDTQEPSNGIASTPTDMPGSSRSLCLGLCYSVCLECLRSLSTQYDHILLPELDMFTPSDRFTLSLLFLLHTFIQALCSVYCVHYIITLKTSWIRREWWGWVGLGGSFPRAIWEGISEQSLDVVRE